MPAIPIDTSQIVITASRTPETKAQTPASVAIVDAQRIERLGEPLVTALLRLTPSAAITTNGPAGSLTEVRIRGSEANHSLLFVDGIKVNDPASGDTPRFELLNADLASRIEVVRGPQSALWGSDAIGGVIAVNGLDQASGSSALAEGGSFGYRRASAGTALRSDKASLAAAAGWQRATGIDSFGSPGGDRDGYRNLSGRLRATIKVGSALSLGAAALALTGRSEFDGYDPLTFAHEDTRDDNRNRLGAGRIWADYGGGGDSWSGQASVSLLDSTNRNDLAATEINRTRGTRRTLDTQIEHELQTGGVTQRLILAAESERETFHARGDISGLSTDQDRSRSHQAVTAEWRADAHFIAADLAARRDVFNRFKDATSIRGSLLAPIGGGFSIAGSYAEGIAQPTFFDLYGFFPGNFVGNPSLKPESSSGFEGSVRFSRAKIAASLTAYRQKLRDEIVDNASFTSSVNSAGTSRRWGVESDFVWRPSEALRLSANFAYLKATQPGGAVAQRVEEQRRPKHSGSVSVDGGIGQWSYGASLAYVGRHLDRRDRYPYDVVRLNAYWLASARVACAIGPGIELFARGSNLLNQHYEDSDGYRTEGRGLFVGIRLADRRSSP